MTAGQVTLGVNDDPTVPRAGVEAPYLQLVLNRLWDEERREGSRRMRLQTLERLGGADRIVRTHLDTALGALPRDEQDLAARSFRYLVTPSGTKIAHRITDLAEYEQIPATQLEPLIDRLAGDVRILRPAGDGRYEIYHDALAGPIADWQRRWQAQKRRGGSGPYRPVRLGGAHPRDRRCGSCRPDVAARTRSMSLIRASSRQRRTRNSRSTRRRAWVWCVPRRPPLTDEAKAALVPRSGKRISSRSCTATTALSKTRGTARTEN